MDSRGDSVCESAPQLHSCIPKRRGKQRTVVESLVANRWAQDIHCILGVHELGQYLILWHMI
jgi:hypothetical protein